MNVAHPRLPREAPLDSKNSLNQKPLISVDQHGRYIDGRITMTRHSQKEAGAYYTPDALVASLVKWAIHYPSDRLLDPSCGDGRFISGHCNSVGIDQDPQALRSAIARAPWASVREGDFFAWAANTGERFECAAGNPPFIRYQTFKGAVRERALSLCARLGAKFSGLTSSWAPFLVASASLLKPGGRMAFVGSGRDRPCSLRCTAS
jgi:adenine-specific DNA methylase